MRQIGQFDANDGAGEFGEDAEQLGVISPHLCEKRRRAEIEQRRRRRRDQAASQDARKFSLWHFVVPDRPARRRRSTGTKHLCRRRH